MKIFGEREELYSQMETEKQQTDQLNRLSINSKQQPKNQSVGPIGRGIHMLTE